MSPRYARRAVVARLVEAAKDAAGVTVADLGAATDFGHACISRQLRGEDAVPLDSLAPIAGLLGVGAGKPGRKLVDDVLAPLGLKAVPVGQAAEPGDLVSQVARALHETSDAAAKFLSAAAD